MTIVRKQFNLCAMKYRTVSILIVLMLLGVSIGGVSAQSNFTPDSTIFIIESRFKLWDNDEKMLDKNFSISLINLNNSKNESYYSIQINENIETGIFNLSVKKYYELNETDLIYSLIIIVDNKTLIDETDIILISGVNKHWITSIPEIFKIALTPSQWTHKQWNIFYAIVFSSLFSLMIGYRINKKWRKNHGVKVIK